MIHDEFVFVCQVRVEERAWNRLFANKEAAPVGEPSSSCESLVSFLRNSVIFLLELEASVAPMNARAARAVARVHNGGHQLLVALACAQRALKPAIYSRLCTLDEKALADRAEEADASSRVLDAVAIYTTVKYDLTYLTKFTAFKLEKTVISCSKVSTVLPTMPRRQIESQMEQACWHPQQL